MGSGAGVAAAPRRPMLHRERPEAAYLDPVTARERCHHLAEYRIDDVFDVTLIEMWILCGDTQHERGFDHRLVAPRPPHATANVDALGWPLEPKIIAH